MGANVSYDFSQYRAFFDKMRAAKGEFKTEINNWFDAIGEEFLNEVRQQIISRNVKRTTLLLHSFERGNDLNFWELDLGALRLEVGSNLEYAMWANNGHRTLDPEKSNHFTLSNGELARYVPGYWQGDEFIYDKNAKSGMVLKFHWVPGKHYFDAALRVFAPQFEKSIERKLEQWLEKYLEK